MTGRALAMLWLPTVVALAGCAAPDARPHNQLATIAQLAGRYQFWTYAEGWAGEAHYLTVEVTSSQDLWERERLCWVWDQITITANGRPMELRQVGGIGGSRGYCRIGFYVLPVAPAEWIGEPEVRFRISDGTDFDDVVFQNFVVAPRVTLVEPADGILRVGDYYKLRFDPSVWVLPSLGVTQGTSGSGIQWMQGYVQDIMLDEHHIEGYVPAFAHVPSTEALHFYSGSGWWAPIVDCSAVDFCFGERTGCTDAGCATPLGVHYYALDDATVTVPISVVP